jgi:hypothetical protein
MLYPRGEVDVQIQRASSEAIKAKTDAVPTVANVEIDGGPFFKSDGADGTAMLRPLTVLRGSR